MAQPWRSVKEAAKGFRNTLSGKINIGILADFQFRLARSLENEKFRNEMAQCGALLNWDDDSKLMFPKWTKETIKLSLEAIEKSGNTSQPQEPSPQTPHQIPPKISAENNDSSNCNVDGSSSIRKVDKPTPVPRPRRFNPPAETSTIPAPVRIKSSFQQTEGGKELFYLTPKPEPALKPRLPRRKTLEGTIPADIVEVIGKNPQASSLLTIGGYIISESEPKPESTSSPTEGSISKEFSPVSRIRREQKSLETIFFHAKWQEMNGEKWELMSPGNFIKITNIIRRPIFKVSDTNLIRTLIPYILQKFKMWGCNMFTSEKMAEMFLDEEQLPEQFEDALNEFDRFLEEYGGSSTGITNKKVHKQQPLCRLDIFATLVATTEATVLAEIFSTLSKFPQTLPLVTQKIDETMDDGNINHILLYPVLQKCMVRWEANGGVIENYLFRSPYKLITAIRMGTNIIGKSSILNQLFVNSNTFQCRGQAGGERGPPLSLDGSVEMIWMLKETCKESVWKTIQTFQRQNGADDEIVLLANLHGDALNNLDILTSLDPITSKFIVFVMPGTVDLKSDADKLVRVCGKEKISFLLVDQGSSESSLSTKFITDMSTLKKLEKHLLGALATSNQYKNPTHMKTGGNTVSCISPLETAESKNFLENVSQVIVQTDIVGGSIRDILLLQKSNSTGGDVLWKLWNSNPQLQKIMNAFVKILHLPLASRRIAFTHIEKELAILSGAKSGKFSTELGKLIALRGTVDSNDKAGLSKVNAEISVVLSEFEKSLGLEHMLRESGAVYEMMMSIKPDDLSLYSKLPELYADLLIEGMTIEILDGDMGSIFAIWLEAVCHSVCDKMPQLRVYVVSILGLQSSGKSTLLNALFGCKFSASMGKCTRGLFMRLMLLEESFREQLNVDAILVVDTEGLGAPESIQDINADTKDRAMATFAMTISNLTLINVMGETKNEVAHILQIVILTMARMEMADLSPDILLVQHVTEGGQEIRLARGVAEFCRNLEDAIDVVDTKEMDLGIRDSKNLANLKTRIQKKEILIPMRSFKNGASPQAPPSDEYHQDVVNLRNRIIKELRSREENCINFCTWHKLLNSYWTAVQRDNFAAKFVSIRQVQEFIEVNGLVASLKNDLDTSFLYHRLFLKEYIDDKLVALDASKERRLTKFFEEEVKDEIVAKIELLPEKCESPLNVVPKIASCKYCIVAEDARQQLIAFVKQTSSVSVSETEAVVANYISDLQKSTTVQMLRLFESGKIQVGKASEFDTVLNNILMTDQPKLEKNYSVENIWDQLVSQISKKYPISNIREQVLKDIQNVYSMAENWSQWQNALHRVPQMENDPIPTLSLLNAKKKRFAYYFKTPDLHLASNEHNWLCEKFSVAAEKVVQRRRNQRQGYGAVMIDEHNREMKKFLQLFEERFKTKLKNEFKWDAILYGVQLFVGLAIEFQNEWDKENEPYWMLLKQKEEYLKKISLFLMPEMSSSASTIAASLTVKILEAATLVTINSLDISKNFNKWATGSENIRLRYLLALAEDLKSGREEVVLEHFHNPQVILTEWYLQGIEASIIESQVPLLKDIFSEECSEIGNQISNTKTSKELTNFISWYLSKVGDSISQLDFITEEMHSELIAEIQGRIAGSALTHSEMIKLENLPFNYGSFLNNLGCTATCPNCSAVCWGQKDHENNLVRFKYHFTCHQPLGLAGLADPTINELLPWSCCEYDGLQDLNTLNDPNKEATQDENIKEESLWMKNKHPVEEYHLLMKWFFYKLNHSLAERFNTKPASAETMERLGFHSLDGQLDKILNVIRHRSEM